MRLRRVLWNPCKKYTRTGHPDTPSEGVRTTYPDRSTLGCRHVHPDVRRHCIWLPRTFHPGCSRPEFKRRIEEVFQLLRTDVSGSSDSVYPDGRAAILHSAAMFSWSFLTFATDILGYFDIFCFRYFMSKFPKSPCNPPMIGFLSY